MKNPTKEAIDAIQNMANSDPEYWAEVLSSRLNNGVGSRTPFTSASALHDALINSEWEPYSHPMLSDDVVAYKTYGVNGWLGVVPISIYDWVEIIDPKDTGFCSAKLVRRTEASRDMDMQDFSVLIVGEENGEKVAFTFHPGDPISPSKVPSNYGLLGQILSGAEANKLGFQYAKL